MTKLQELEQEWNIAFVKGVNALPKDKNGIAILGRHYNEILKPTLQAIQDKINIIKKG